MVIVLSRIIGHSHMGFGQNISPFTEHYSVRRAGFSAGWLHAILNAVPAEGAFLNFGPGLFPLKLGYIKGAGILAITAAYAALIIPSYRSILMLGQSCNWADRNTGGVGTVEAPLMDKMPTELTALFYFVEVNETVSLGIKVGRIGHGRIEGSVIVLIVGTPAR
jgi:hypothetical protein